MRLPREISGDELIKSLGRLGYSITRQTGSHVRLTNLVRGEHHITIPKHKFLKIGTLNSILNEVSQYLEISKDKLVQRLFS
jgi:predicted RNA binding protein YcfA (HicA-like mRNA interferase family)